MQTFRLPRVVHEDLELPGWDDMSDRDRGEALNHVAKREIEGDDYAISDYPCRYHDDPALAALTREQACEHAAQVTGYYETDDTGYVPDERRPIRYLPIPEIERLCDLAR